MNKNKQGDPLLLEIQEEINRENMMRMMNKYGSFALTLTIIFLLGFSGYEIWKYFHRKQVQATGTEIYEVMRDMDQPQDEFTLQKLDDAAKQKNFRAIALLNKAEIQLKNNDYNGAVESYDAVAKDESSDKALRDLAALNSANILLNNNPKIEGLEKRLTDLNDGNNVFKYTAMELLAAFYAQNGNAQKADEILAKLAKEPNVPITISKRARDANPESSSPDATSNED